MTLDECDFIYKVLGQKVFSRTVASKDKEESWMESFYRTFHTRTQHVRAVVVGSKHDGEGCRPTSERDVDWLPHNHLRADPVLVGATPPSSPRSHGVRGAFARVLQLFAARALP